MLHMVKFSSDEYPEHPKTEWYLSNGSGGKDVPWDLVVDMLD